MCVCVCVRTRVCMGVRERERIAARLGEFVLWMHIFSFLHIDYSIDSY